MATPSPTGVPPGRMRRRDLPVGHPGRDLLSGRTPLWASQFDQRFSWCLYLPSRFDDDGPAHHVVVGVHGNGRDVVATRENLIPLAEATNAVVVSPLFPCGIVQADDVHNFKLVDFEGIRFDQVLLAMLDEIAARFNVTVDKFALAGYSGGGQFVHRFAYAHADRLLALSLGAPGDCTLLGSPEPWPVGVGDFAERFGTPPAIEALRTVPVQIVVGSRDTVEFAFRPHAVGANRFERCQILRSDWEALGVEVQFDVVPGVAHDSDGVAEVVRDFLRPHLAHAALDATA